jgi:hypothetical protein
MPKTCRWCSITSPLLVLLARKGGQRVADEATRSRVTALALHLILVWSISNDLRMISA